MTGLHAHVVVDRGAWGLDARLDVGPGRTLVLLGPNGAGKTTLLRAIAGLAPLDAGQVRLDGRTLDDPDAGVWVPPERRGIGVVFQDYLLFRHLSALDNVAFGLREKGIRRSQARSQARGWLSRLDVLDVAAARPGRLSGGQAQRVALARALAVGPRLLLLDEPLAALDAGARGAVRAELRAHLGRFDGPCVVVTHDPVDAMVLGDTVVVVEDGRVVQSGPPGEVARRPVTRYVADLVGVNLLRGHADAGVVDLDGGGRLRLPDSTLTGDTWLALRPESVSLHRTRPEGSPRNVWRGIVGDIEARGDRVRVSVVGSPPVVVVVTPAAVADLALAPGVDVWCSAKAIEVEAYPA